MNKITRNSVPGNIAKAFHKCRTAVAVSVVLHTFMTFTQAAISPPGSTHVIKADGQVRCEIVLADDSGTVAAFAAREIKRFMDKALDAAIPIVNVATGDRTAIILGNSKSARDAGIDVNKLPRDGFIIRSVDNSNIVIVGRDDMKVNAERSLARGAWGVLFERGTLFGVYDFLERFLGVRFYFPGDIGTVVPRRDKLMIERIDIAGSPDYTSRKSSWVYGMTPDGKTGIDSMFFKNLNYLRLRFETKLIPNCHGLGRLGYIKRFGESNPEYFALMANGQRHNDPSLSHPGQLCFNSGIREEIYRDAEAFLLGKPASSRGARPGHRSSITDYVWDPSGFLPGYFNIQPEDSFYFCHCSECDKIFSKGEQAITDFIWGFVSEIAERLKKNGIPGYVTMMSYGVYSKVPNVEIPDNVLVMVCRMGPWGMVISPPGVQEADDELIKAWVKKLGRKVWLWSSCSKWGRRSFPGIPHMAPRYFGEYYKLQRPYIFGGFVESHGDRFIQSYLDNYVFARVAWDNSTDVDALLDEHYILMFGDAAKVMEEIYNTFTDKWFQIVGQPIETPLGPDTVPVSDYTLWETIYSSSEMERIRKMFDSASRLTAYDESSLQRVKFMRMELFDPIEKSRLAYENNKKEMEDWKFYAAPTTDSAISLDGVLDEEEWGNTEVVFLRPFEGRWNIHGKQLVETTVRALRCERYIYFAFDCEEPEIDSMTVLERDFDDRNIWKDSSVEIFLNPSGDEKIYYQIFVNARGALSDLKAEQVGSGRETNWDWNSGAKVAVSKSARGWIAEIAVPIENLKGFSDQGFRINLNRNRILESSSDEYVVYYTWSPFLKYSFTEPENFGTVVFEKDNRNIIENGDFTGSVKGRFMDGWWGPQEISIKNGESFEIVSDCFIKGGKSLLLKSPVSGRINVAQRLPKLKPNTEYLLSFFVKMDDVVSFSQTGGVYVNIWDDKNRWFPRSGYVGTMPWSKQGFRFTTGPETNKEIPSYIRLRILDAKGAVWFDDVRLREIDN